MNDQKYMELALKLAKKGQGFVSPNPLVGAVIVKDGRILGQGYHQRYGEFHAERNALASCRESPAGATMYVTLEPCCHYGKQPPCVHAILEAGISRIVIGSRDPNPLVAGKGIDILRSSGVSVSENVLTRECNKLNEVFFHYIQKKEPFVILKYAMTMDGKIAAYTGLSQWITGEEARAHVHEQRHRCKAIMVGVGTVLTDNPLLTCRMEGGNNPVRIICDTHLMTPLSSQIVTTAVHIPTIIATCQTDEEKQKKYKDAGCHFLILSKYDEHVNLKELMKKLGEAEIDSILLEGGETLNWSALKSGIVQKIHAYIAPKLFGGSTAKTPIGGKGVPSPSHGIKLKESIVTQLGKDFLIESEVCHHVYGNY